ncbi:hypothetical protein [Flavicella sediminum]|uniref:hypothetical protein n=1 Tax=Flavicella sediminum TaxID=2585141 RepID=UPI001123BEA8|nr:hypothetical protein [Flavicella sediminum]
MKGGVLKIIWVVLAFAVGFFGFKWIFQQFSSKGRIEKIADELNVLCPKRYDAFTRLDSVVSGGQGRIVYYCSLIQQAKNEADKNALTRHLKQARISDVMRNSGMEIFRKNLDTVQFDYFDSQKELMVSISVGPLEYLDPASVR